MNNVAKGLALIVATTFPLSGQLAVNELRDYQLSKMSSSEQLVHYKNQLTSLQKMIPPPKGCLAYSHAQSINYCKDKIAELTICSGK